MHIAIISGSHRNNSQSGRIGRYLETALKKIDDSTTTTTIDLAGNPLPLWDESAWQPGSALQKLWQPIAEKLRAADGFIVISPEWAGMVPAGLKNFFLFATPKDVGHKPALIVGVSASRGGAYPVEELRISSYKNNKISYLPEHLIVRDAEKMFVGDSAATPEDGYIRNRADFALKILLGYTSALQTVRASGVTEHKDFPFGM
jgi:NAD(P)H-dependent FMN reductase